MKRNISLYIKDQLVDIDEDNLILFNFTQEELENPTIVRNSYSQQITIKGTPQNNKIFTSAFRLDKIASVGFNPRVKTDFVIFNELGEILEKGYAKLDTISRKTEIEYKVTLYGVLGSILYDLSYNDDGSKKTLADLDFLGTSNPAAEFNYTIDRSIVRNAWTSISGEHPIDLFDVINFAPCYNGKPSGFAADKAIIDSAYVSFDPGINYRASLAREYTEQETHDLRSYLQRPVLRVRAILDGIGRFVRSKDWTLDIEQSLYNEDIIQRTWMTLPLLDVKGANGMRSGVAFTKKDILAGTASPAEFLISLCKMFGLKIYADPKKESINIMSRGTFFSNNVIDLSSRINLAKGRTITPLLISSKWYEMSSEDKGEFATKYQSMYGRIYGSQRINTGYQFNSEIKTITENMILKGGVQSQETSPMFLSVFNEDGDPIPAPFIEGGSYKVKYQDVDQEAEFSLIPSRYSYTWFNQQNKGYDFTNLVQLHAEDNKPIDGAGVLLYFDAMVDCPEDYGISDDIPDLMEDLPCWNFTQTNRTLLEQIPHFSRFLMSIADETAIESSLDWGESKELNIPGFSYDQPNMGIYLDRWEKYLSDRYDQDTKMVRLHVNLQGLQVGVDLMRDFYWFDNCVWSLNKIINHSLTSWDDTECEFVQVQNINNYR